MLAPRGRHDSRTWPAVPAPLAALKLFRLCFEFGDFCFQTLYFAWLVVLFPGSRQLLAQHLQPLVQHI